MYLTFKDYSLLNEWIDKYMEHHTEVTDMNVQVTTTGCTVVATFVEQKERFNLLAKLYIGECNPFRLYTYNKFCEDMNLIIGQKIMESRL